MVELQKHRLLYRVYFSPRELIPCGVGWVDVGTRAKGMWIYYCALHFIGEVMTFWVMH
jgi:hypothetical protein